MTRLKTIQAFSALLLLVRVPEAFPSSSPGIGAALGPDWSRWTSPAPITSMRPRDSLLWMSTQDGLARIPIEGGPATVYTTRNSGIPFDTLTTVDVAYEGEVLMGSAQGAIALGENGSWTSYSSRNAPLNNGEYNHLVSGITRTKDGMLWLAARSSTFTFNDVETDFNSYEGDAEVLYYSVFEGAQGAVHAFDGSKWTTAFSGSLQKKEVIETVLGIVSDPEGNVWSASRKWLRGFGTVISIQKGDGRSLHMAQQFSTRNYTSSPDPWISDLQATHEGMWASFYGIAKETSGSRHALLFFSVDTAAGIASIVSLDSLPPSGFHPSNPSRIFALDTNGNPWVLAGNALHGFDKTGMPLGVENLPEDLAAKGPFREMRIDRKGILFLRTDSTVYWNVKPKEIPTALHRAAKGGPLRPAPRRIRKGVVFPWSGRLPGEAYDPRGRALGPLENAKPSAPATRP